MFLPKVNRSGSEAPQSVSRERVAHKPVSVRASRDRSPRGSHGKESERESRRKVPVSIPFRDLEIPEYRSRQGSPPLMTSHDASVARSPQGRRLKTSHTRSARSDAGVVVDSAYTIPHSHFVQDQSVLHGLGGPNSARRNVTPPRRSNSRASSSVGARPPSPATSSFNRSSVSGRPASSVNESRELDDSVASIAPNSTSLRLREMMEVVSPLINPDLSICRQYLSLAYRSLVLGHSSRAKELTEALTAYTGSVNSGKWVNESALPLRASRFGTNNSHVPIRSKFLPPSLLSKKVKAEKL